MGRRESLQERVQALLPDEQVQQVFMAQAGANPWIGNSFGLLGQFMVKRRIIAVTDQAVVVFGATFNGTTPTEMIRRLPRQTRLGPVKGIWSTINIGAEKTWVHRKFHKDVKAADAALSPTQPDP
jgi:hypothetical protein